MSIPGDEIFSDGCLEVFLDISAIGFLLDVELHLDLDLAGRGPGPDLGYDGLQRLLRGFPLPVALLAQAPTMSGSPGKTGLVVSDTALDSRASGASTDLGRCSSSAVLGRGSIEEQPGSSRSEPVV